MPPEDFAALARSVERGQAAAMVELSAEAEPVEDGWMTFGGLGAFVNRACGLGLSGPASKEAARDVVDFFVSRGVEPRVELCSYVHPSLLRALGKAGFELLEFESVLYRRLEAEEDFFQALPCGWPEGLTVSRVDAQDALAVEEYVRVSHQGFLQDGAKLSEGSRQSALKAPVLPHYDSLVARLHGTPVGAGGCATRGSLLALFGTSVQAEFRKLGVQQALMAARLEHGRARGATLATIASLPGAATERNALRLGFRMAYTRAIFVRPGEGLAPSR
jgi:GNAT superfamily N-acetyltransferase